MEMTAAEAAWYHLKRQNVVWTKTSRDVLLLKKEVRNAVQIGLSDEQ